jgi:tRNA nucleotidyltransferase (CCA-adding enzyme)
MMDHKDVERFVLEKVKPTMDERLEISRVVDSLKNRVRCEIEQRGLNVSLELVGSIAKDTYIRGNVDIDLFMVFPLSVKRDKLKKHVLEIGKAVLEEWEECYAEHPYIRGYYKGYDTEIVPCYRIESSSQRVTAVDRTPLHTSYVKKHLKEEQKDEVRLLKQFLKGIGCYGAEAKVEGFSGYLCELLIIRYGSFYSLLSEANKWCYKERITLDEDSKVDFDNPLIVIDPVDPKRNVASALSKDKFDLFTLASRMYVKKPDLRFFYPKKVKPWSISRIKKELKEREGVFVGLEIKKPRVIDENLYPQIRKSIRVIREMCESYNFKVMDIGFTVLDEEEKVYIIIKTKDDKLPRVETHTGPPVHLKRNVDDFISKWINHPCVIKEPYVKDGRLYVEKEREYSDVYKLLNEKLKNLSLGKDIIKEVNKGFKVLKQGELIRDELKEYWTTLLDGKHPWER